MPKVKCPVPNCEYETADVSDSIILKLLDMHSSCHTNPAGPTHTNAPTKVERVRRPIVTSAGTSEEWTYFLTRWTEYATATGVGGKDRIIQLLECCDEGLRKDLTRSAGGTLTLIRYASLHARLWRPIANTHNRTQEFS